MFSEENTNPQLSPLYIFPPNPNRKPSFSSVHRTLFYNFFGRVLAFQSDHSSALEFCSEHAAVDSPSLESFISDFISLTHSHCVGETVQKQSCHITLWLWKSQRDGFGNLVWHRNGPLYSLEVDSMPFARSKFTVALLGQLTLILVNTTHVIETATRAYEDDLRYDQMAQRFEKAGIENADCEKIKPGQVVRFTWGEKDSPVHKEPVITEDRVFMNVIYGTEDEIRALAEWQEEKYHCDG